MYLVNTSNSQSKGRQSNKHRYQVHTIYIFLSALIDYKKNVDDQLFTAILNCIAVAADSKTSKKSVHLPHPFSQQTCKLSWLRNLAVSKLFN